MLTVAVSTVMANQRKKLSMCDFISYDRSIVISETNDNF